MQHTVGNPGGRARDLLALSIMLAGMLLTIPPCGFALDPSLDANQYAHTAWKIRDGFVKGEIISIAQTPDGYLWLGTEFGLLRFDGVRTVPWQSPSARHLATDVIRDLLAARDGTLWIGADQGLASWKDGKLTQYSELAGQWIFKLVEDHDGTIWVGGVGRVPPGKLCAIQNGSAHCFGEDGIFGRGVAGLYEDSKGNLWVGVKSGLWRWKPGPPKFYPLAGNPNGVQAIGEDSDGTLLVGWKDGIYRFIQGKTEANSLLGSPSQFKATTILRDRDSGLWIGTRTHGLVHVRRGRTELFTKSDGLSGDEVGTNGLFEDREGNIWVTTLEGLDRFRDFAVATFSVKQGLSEGLVGSVLVDTDRSILLATYSGLNRWKDGQITIPPTGSSKLDGKINGQDPHSLFQDSRGRIWISTLGGVCYLENGRFVRISAVPGGNVLAITQDTAGNLWLANEVHGLFRVSSQNEVRQIPWAELGHKDHASVLAADPSRAGIWIGFFLGGIAYFEDGHISASYAVSDGLGEGRVGRFRFDPDGTVWVATEGGGLSRIKNGRVATLTSKNGLPCDVVHWVIRDNDQSFWLYTSCGLVRITRPELDAWAAAVDQNKDTQPAIHATVFDSPDGVRSLALGGHYSPQVARTPDGKIWFLPWDGVSVFDPRHLHINDLPPPMHIEQIIADDKTYDVSPELNGRVGLPPRIRDIEIDYTALSLVAPEKVRFRYKLEGWDRDWHDGGARREAFYSHLPPRPYRFRVMACNNSGVWNEGGASLDFFVAPAYYQTWWFRSMCVFALLGLLAMLHRLRLHQQALLFNKTLDARVAERTRVARDLHDTLLQSFQGVLLKFHAVSYMLGDRPEAQKSLAKVIDQARQAIAEGRDAVQGLRSSTLVGNDLARAIRMLGEELTTHHSDNRCPDFGVQVEGRARDLAPILRDDIYRIAGEAIRNAFRHAQASRIEVELRYDQRQLRLRIRDNGKGVDPKVLESGARTGHYGLPGMHERAKLVGAKLTIWSEVDSGTEAELTIPASIAYAKSKAKSQSTVSQTGNG